MRQVPHATAPFMRYVYIAAYTHFELFISTAFVAFDPRPSETIEIRGRFSCVLLYNSVFLCSFGNDSDPYDMRRKPYIDGEPYDMRRKHYGTTLMNGEEGALNNDESNANCTSLISKVYPLSTIQSSSAATMQRHMARPHVSHRAFSFTGSTTTLCSGLAKAMPSTDMGEAGKPRFIHVLRTLMSTPPWLCIRPRICHHNLRD